MIHSDSFSAQTITTIIVGIPTVILAAASYVFSRRVHQDAISANKYRVDSEAYIRAKELYESTISELRKDAAECHAEIERIKMEMATATKRIAELEQEVTTLQRGKGVA
jgi:chromosome segregation ATPase